jgi:Fic family protein
VGQLVPITLPANDPRGGPTDYFAYVPSPLPGEITLNNSTWVAANDAANAIGALNNACAHLPNPRLLIGPALVQEAHATSALEGTYGAIRDVMQARLPGFEPQTPEIREISAYIDMADFAFSWVRDRPITIGFLCDMQRVLAEASRHPVRDPGSIRTEQVYIGPEEAPISESRFVPPPPDDRLQAGLDAWLSWVQTNRSLPVEIRVAMAHYQFETLHPFADCNGRVGRLLILLQLLVEGRLGEPVLTLSPWLLKRRTRYQDHLLATSSTGDWNPWIRFFCEGLREQCDRHVVVAQELLDWLAGVRSRLNERHWTGTIGRLAEDLIDWPVVTNGSVQRQYDCSGPTAQKAIDRLVELEVLEELTGGSYARIWGARKVMQLAESL